MPLKILNRSLVFLSCRLCIEGSQIPVLPCLRVFLPRIQPIFSGLEFPDHAALISLHDIGIGVGEAFARARGTLQ